MDQEFLSETIQLSRDSVHAGGFPVGALVVLDGKIIGTGISNGKNQHDATAHAEIIAIRNASSEIKKRDLYGATVYSSMEPCMMCLHACSWAKVERVVYVLSKEKLDQLHFEGVGVLSDVNTMLHKPLELVHVSELEEDARRVISNWKDLL